MFTVGHFKTNAICVMAWDSMSYSSKETQHKFSQIKMSHGEYWISSDCWIIGKVNGCQLERSVILTQSDNQFDEFVLWNRISLGNNTPIASDQFTTKCQSVECPQTVDEMRESNNVNWRDQWILNYH